MDHFEVSAEHAEHAEPSVSLAASLPLELGILAFTTAILGSLFAGFPVPATDASLSLLAAVAFFGGLVQFVSGVMDLRQDQMLTGTLFTAYGGFLMMLGVIVAPPMGMMMAALRFTHSTLGVLFLAWTIFVAIMLLSTLKTRVTLVITLSLLFLTYLLLTIGELAGGSVFLLVSGGWLAILTGLVAWYGTFACLLSRGSSLFRLPM